MRLGLVILWVACSAALSLLFSILTYALRDLSRTRLANHLERRGLARLVEPTIEHNADLQFITAFLRLLSNILVLVSWLYLFHVRNFALWQQYVSAVIVTGITTLIVSVAIPQAVAGHYADPIVAFFAPFLHGMRRVLLPVTKLMHAMDAMMARTAPADESSEQIEQDIEDDILSAVEEGEKEGVVDEKEREMIERVIAFHDTQAGQIMTPRPEIRGIESTATLEEVKQTIAACGHSRIPVYDGSLDHIIGVLYARDLLKLLGRPGEEFRLKEVMRPALFVPETKMLKDLLRDFTLQKVHIAFVLDEYGGTSGLVTIEDILEELVGEISDEHEPEEPAMLKRLSETSVDADARIAIAELNRVLGLSLPEDAGYETLGGFITMTLGRIPERDEAFEHAGVRFTIIDAQPQRVNRARIDLLPQTAAS